MHIVILPKLFLFYIFTILISRSFFTLTSHPILKPGGTKAHSHKIECAHVIFFFLQPKRTTEKMFSCLNVLQIFLLVCFFMLIVPLSVCFIKLACGVQGLNGQGLSILRNAFASVSCYSVWTKWCLYGIIKYRAIPVSVHPVSCNETWDLLFCL